MRLPSDTVTYFVFGVEELHRGMRGRGVPLAADVVRHKLREQKVVVSASMQSFFSGQSSPATAVR